MEDKVWSNVFELWRDNGERLPFRVRRWSWNKATYAVVESVVIKIWPYGVADGYLVIMNHLGKGKVVRCKAVLACAGCYQWEFVGDGV